jgi:hypothetical protein
LDASVIEYQIDRAELIGNLLGGCGDGRPVGDIEGQRESGTGGSGDARCQSVELVGAACRDGDLGAEGGQPERGGFTDTAGGPGDDGDAPRQRRRGDHCRHVVHPLRGCSGV